MVVCTPKHDHHRSLGCVLDYMAGRMSCCPRPGSVRARWQVNSPLRYVILYN